MKSLTKPERFPDFFLIGAPRCGTTSLSGYLANNPQVCFSRPKEPHYFTLFASNASPDDLKNRYLARYFSHYQESHKAIGEGSVSYLYSPDALRRILSLNPQARFIAILRNPLDMLASYHLRMRFTLMEDVDDFAAAWDLQEMRARGERIPKHCLDPQMLLYREVASFGQQIERLYQIVGRDRCLVLLFDDLVRDPLTVYKNVLQFIEVEYDGRTKFQRKLGSRIYRYHWLQRVLYAPLASKAHVKRTLDLIWKMNQKKKATGKKSRLERLARWNTIPTRPTPLAPDVKRMLQDTLAEDVTKLSDLLQRDLSHWLNDR